MPRFEFRTFLPVALLLLATGLVFFPGLSGDFLFDDFPNIVQNTRVQPDTLDAAALRRAADGYQPGLYGRPLATIGFAVDYLIGGKDATVYKVHSLLVHALNAFLVFLLATRLMRLRGAPAFPTWAPFALAFAWAVHPLQVSTVLYVVQRMEMLAATFVLLGLLAYLRGRARQLGGQPGGWGWIFGAAVLAGVGMLAKESAILFPLFTLALELVLLRFDGPVPARRVLRSLYTVAMLAGLILFVGWVLPRYLAEGAYASRDFTAGERVLTQLRVLPMYIGQMLLPLPDSMTFYYDNYPTSTGLLAPRTTLAGGLLLLALAGAAWTARRRMPLFTLGVFWFFAAHTLTSNVIRLEMVFEHRNYFALFGVLLAVADALRTLGSRLGIDRGALIVGAAIAGFAALTLLRSATWGDPVLLATDLAQRNPGSPRASSDLATIYAGLADGNSGTPHFAIAMAEFERGSRLPGSSPLPEQGLILMAATAGLPVDPAWWDRIDQKLRTRPISPQETMAVTGLVSQRMKGVTLDDDRLSQAYRILLERKPGNASLQVLFATYLLDVRGDEEAAGLHFARAIALQPDDPAYAARIVEGLVADGHRRAAKVVVDFLRGNGQTAVEGSRSD